MECIKNSMNNKTLPESDNYISAELTDNLIMKGSCKYGHESFFIIQNPKFEILFDLGIISLLDGYTREAVSSLVASYERFIEFASEIFMIKYIKDSNLPFELFKKYKLSERQIGIFAGLYTIIFKELPPKMSDQNTKFRNDVIHNGKIPTEAEVNSFGEGIVSFVNPILNKIKSELSEELMQYTNKSIMNRTQTIKISGNLTTMCMGNGFGVYSAGDNNDTFVEKVKSVDLMKNISFSKFFEQEKRNSRYQILEMMFGKYI